MLYQSKLNKKKKKKKGKGGGGVMTSKLKQ